MARKPKPLNSPYCIVGATLPFGERQMKRSVAEAKVHGEELLRKRFAQDGRPNKVFIVKVVEVLSCGEPTIVSRKPTEDDKPAPEDD